MQAHVAHPFARLVPVVLVLLAACTDGIVDSRVQPPPGGPAGTPVTLQEVACRVQLRQETVSCGRPDGTGASGDLIVGGQGVYVTLTGSDVAYNSGTGSFTFTTTITSLIEQPIGTTDGTTLDPNGVRIFFFTGPAVSAGTGTVAVVPDGFAFFTAASQPYYVYNEVLGQGETSAGKTWTFVVPPTVESFVFTVLVAAAVEYPTGYITLNGLLPDESFGSLHPDSAATLSAQVKNVVGNPLGGTVTFGTSDPLCATVDLGGMVTGKRAGTCSITATSAGRSGSLTFSVTGTTRVWGGALSTDWGADGNWTGGMVPAAVDSVYIPVAVPNLPVLDQARSVGGLTLEDAATLSLGALDLTADADVASAPVSGGISSSTGRLVLAGSGTVKGLLPTVLVTGSYALSGDVTAVAAQQVDAGQVASDSWELRIQSQ